MFFELQFERLPTGREKDGHKQYPPMDNISLRLFFPEYSPPDNTF
jgi:hypothetical protein